MKENNTNVFDYYKQQRKIFDKLRLSMIKMEQKEKERLYRTTLSKEEIIHIIFDKDGK